MQLNKSATSVFGYENAQLFSTFSLRCTCVGLHFSIIIGFFSSFCGGILSIVQKSSWKRNNDYNWMKGSEVHERERENERGFEHEREKRTRRRRKSAIFISFLYRKIFLPIFFSRNFIPFVCWRSFRSILSQFPFFLLCCYCPFPPFRAIKFIYISSLSPFIALHLPIYCIACVGLTDFNKMLSDWEKIYWKFSIGWRLFSLFFSFFRLCFFFDIRLLFQCVLSEFLYSLFYFILFTPHSLSLSLTLLLIFLSTRPDHELLSSNVVWTSHLAFDFYRFFYNTR